MALTLKYAFGATCGAGTHVTVTATLTPGGSIAIPTIKADLLRPVTADEKAGAALTILRMLANQLPSNATAAQLKTAIEALTISLTVA